MLGRPRLKTGESGHDAPEESATTEPPPGPRTAGRGRRGGDRRLRRRGDPNEPDDEPDDDHRRRHYERHDHQGVYSEYGQGQGQTFLRGIQVTDGQGQATFDTVYPGWYQGRATHIHVEVTSGGRSVKVTQIAFPEDVTAAVYQTGVYAAKGLNSTTNARDNVFADSVSQEMITLSGNTASGFTGTFQVGVTI